MRIGKPMLNTLLGVTNLVKIRRLLSYYPGKECGELHDLESDPHELINRRNDPSMQATKRRLKDKLLDRVLATHDPLPVREEPY